MVVLFKFMQVCLYINECVILFQNFWNKTVILFILFQLVLCRSGSCT